MLMQTVLQNRKRHRHKKGVQMKKKSKQATLMKLMPESITSRLEEYKNLMCYYQCAIMEIETKFNVLNAQFSLQKERNHIETIKTRLKSPESILEKLERKGYPISVNSIEQNLDDVAGVRVICPFIQDIYILYQCFSQQDDIKILEIKDYIKNPKPNGYRSLHMIVEVPIFLQNEKRLMRVEVQLRTIAMDFWASLEHRLRYKKDLNEELAAMLSEELKQCAEESAGLDLRMGMVKESIEKYNK